MRVLASTHKLNITSTDWQVNCVSRAKMVGRDKVVRVYVLSDCGGKIVFSKDYLIEDLGMLK